jgi:molybdopterin-guanine dinucleotide biosynthesis protein A
MHNIIILAGIQTIKNWDNGGNKALFPINGKIMVEYVLDAVKNAGDIDKIVVVGPAHDLERHLHGMVDAVIDSNGSIMDNIREGIKYLGTERHVLICSCDIPLITSDAINDFISKSKMLDADLCYPIVEKKVNYAKYPEMERTYVKTREGTFTGGNIFYVNPGMLEKGFEFVDKLLKVRKKPLKMARVLGFRFVAGLLLGTVSIGRIERRFHDILGINGRAVISEYPEIGNDVDKPSDVAAAQAHLSRQV